MPSMIVGTNIRLKSLPKTLGTAGRKVPSQLIIDTRVDEVVAQVIRLSSQKSAALGKFYRLLSEYGIGPSDHCDMSIVSGDQQQMVQKIQQRYHKVFQRKPKVFAVKIGQGRYLELYYGMPAQMGLWGIRGSAATIQQTYATLTIAQMVHTLGEITDMGSPKEHIRHQLVDLFINPKDRPESRPILADQELIATLRVFFAVNLNPSIAARSMSLHRNTVIYRLDKVRTITKLDPMSFFDAATLALSLGL